MEEREKGEGEAVYRTAGNLTGRVRHMRRKRVHACGSVHACAWLHACGWVAPKGCLLGCLVLCVSRAVCEPCRAHQERPYALLDHAALDAIFDGEAYVHEDGRDGGFRGECAGHSGKRGWDN